MATRQERIDELTDDHDGPLTAAETVELNRPEQAERLIDTIDTGRADEVMHFLVEYLAEWGPNGVDVQALAVRVFERIEETD